MTVLARAAPAALLRWEAALVCIAAWAAFASIPLALGSLGLGWDALNHHIYLGWMAEQPRFALDFVAAGYQSYQFPYLYWPVFKLSALGWTGTATGVALATVQVAVVPPIWLLARLCVPGKEMFDVALRCMAVALGLLSSVVLSMLHSTQNDLLAAIPLVWAVALAMEPVARASMASGTVRRYVLLSGACAGLAVAAKLSNGPLVLLLPALWLLAARDMRGRLLSAGLGCAAVLGAFLLAYGYWGFQLWEAFGNPVYPLYDGLFAPLRARAGAG